MLRDANHLVYDFRNPKPGDTGFHWSDVDPEWKAWSPTAYRTALTHPISLSGFRSDYDAMEWADTGVLVLPSGRSAHLEAGYFVGAGKDLFILLLPEEDHAVLPELMYLMANRICVTQDELLDALTE